MSIMDILGEVVGSENESFESAYDTVLNKFVTEFESQFCTDEGDIKWDDLLSFNSG